MPQFDTSVRRKAILAVLVRFGEDNLVMLKHNLSASYEIDLDNDETFTLEELQIALQRLLGANGAGLIIKEIHNEMRLLAAE